MTYARFRSPSGPHSGPYKNRLACLPRPASSVRWSLVLSALIGLVIVLIFLPGRRDIPPRIQSDYCYQLIAADRLYEGLGLTSLQPVAPRQPWTWEYDFGFLTQWPIGYPLAVYALRCVFRVSAIQACGWISVVVCVTALVGWFTFIRRCTPRGVAGLLLAAVAAGCSVSTASLIHPSTDAILVALLPFAMLFAVQGVESLAPGSDRRSKRTATHRLILAGLLAGGLFWFRYASVFLPPAIGVYLLIEWRRGLMPRLRHIAAFAFSAATPIALLLLINHLLGSAGSTQRQLNLGHEVGFAFSPDLLSTVWWKWTDLGFYDYHRISHRVFALFPAGVVVAALIVPSARRTMRSFLSEPAVRLSMVVVAALLAMLVTTTALFGDKYNYVDWDRYYLPVRPLYFLLFATPVLLIRGRVIRMAACVALVLACSWTLQVEWSRPYRRWLGASRMSPPAHGEVTPYGQWAVCFGPGASDLYAWLGRQETDNLIVVSNFREYITLETKIPTLPIPDNPATLHEWVRRISASRGIARPRVLFVLDPDNRWRSYWLAGPTDVIHTFALTRQLKTPPSISAHVFEYNGIPDGKLAVQRKVAPL